jgi:hypothetical protein
MLLSAKQGRPAARSSVRIATVPSIWPAIISSPRSAQAMIMSA